MPLTRGSRVGSYEIGSLLGAGGMGEVYRARDTKLGRDVAIKVLPPGFTADAERLTRFEREARVLASLNHPHIGAIYGLEEAGGIRALVLELVEGETLAERIARSVGRVLSDPPGLPGPNGPGLQINDALAIARQIADALDAAHERGIVHRDLKPANIKITPDGVVKVLDFGLAKAGGAGEAGGELTHSPTMMGPTLGGVLLGTAPYMSPEQARGKSVDKRTDIWAFGCVLYEMLTGRRAFTGETTTDVLAKIVEREPDWTQLPPSAPAYIVRLIKCCLEKDPKKRLRDIGDMRVELDDDFARAGARLVPPARPRSVGALTAAALSLAALLAITVAVWWLRPAPAIGPATEFTFGPPDGATLEDMAPVPSPDGTRVAFVASRSSSRKRRLRRVSHRSWLQVLDPQSRVIQFAM
ncbi:MAG: serine/threonine protein kinase [Acidobacteria bacterium]|nr:serine/threonine protein kinase [Acidobacteriota bacterium]